MSQTGSASTTTPEAALLNQLLTQLGGDLFSTGSGLLISALTSIQANPTPQNVIAQGVQIALVAPLQLPNLEKEAIGQIAATGLQLLALGKPPVISV